MDAVGKGGDHLAQEGRAVGFGAGVEEGKVGELRDPVWSAPLGVNS
jgi:hypothetical protein